MQDPVEVKEGGSGYRPQQRRAIIAAVSLLAVIMTGAAFSAGVYIGNNRELAPGTLAGAGAPARQGQPGAPQVQGGQPGTFDLQGVFQAATASNLTLATPGGPRPVGYDVQTRFVRPDGTTLRVTALTPGTAVGVKLRTGAQQPLADVVTVLGQTGAGQPAP